MTDFLRRVRAWLMRTLARLRRVERVPGIAKRLIWTRYARHAQRSRPLLTKEELAALQGWRRSSAYKAFEKVIEFRAAQTAERIFALPERHEKAAYERGRLAAYDDVFTLAEYVTQATEAYYDRQRKRDDRERDRQLDKPGARHWGSPNWL